MQQYNKDKPNKFRVDFFVLANNNHEKYFIYHLDVYQGKNAANIGIPAEIQDMPTTQKAVVNAMIQSGISKDVNGMRRLFTDSRYTAAALFILLREEHDILVAGTTQSNRIGWPKDLMDLTSSGECGTSKVLYNKVNKILVTQSIDNKVVSCS